MGDGDEICELSGEDMALEGRSHPHGMCCS